MANLDEAVEAGKALGKMALYFGCWGKQKGHYLVDPTGLSKHAKSMDCPWPLNLMDTGLLDNGNVRDEVTGKVFWTCGGDKAFWYAFYWWDRSVDSRPNSNSGFYVRGFGYPEAQEAFDWACTQFPKVVARQKIPLALQVDWRNEKRRAVK